LAEEADTLDLFAVVGGLFALAGEGLEARARGAALFHLALADGLAAQAARAAAAQDTADVVLAGGCFANRVLSQRLRRGLEAAGLKVHLPMAAGCGDAGLALGQAWVAACTPAASALGPTLFPEF
jgi:hydrogenase maturation protein HypF